MIKYIGSKRCLVPLLSEVITRLDQPQTVLDLFSGTSRVGYALKQRGLRVIANDHNTYAATLARCYVQADREHHQRAVEQLVAEFNRLPGQAGYFTEMFCVRSRFFQPQNGERIDAIREAIAQKALEPELEAVLLTALMEAADRVDSTTGLQMAYLKQWAPRSFQALELRVPTLLPQAAAGKGEAHQLDALDAMEQLTADVAYIDPPYNQHKYLGNYHIWESLVLWDKPSVYGVACKRADCRTRDSVFNSRPLAERAFRDLIRKVRAKHLVISFNNEGYFSRPLMEEILSLRGTVLVMEQDFKRYVGAQIGIYNPAGQKVGQVSHLTNKEYVFVVTDSAELQERLAGATARWEQEVEASHSGAQLFEQLRALLHFRGHITSAQAQAELGAEARTLRPLFQRLVSDGRAYTTGERRGRVYHWANKQPVSLSSD